MERRDGGIEGSGGGERWKDGGVEGRDGGMLPRYDQSNAEFEV